MDLNQINDYFSVFLSLSFYQQALNFYFVLKGFLIVIFISVKIYKQSF